MSGKRIWSTSLRVLRQLRHDHRTLALIFFMPATMLTILYFVFERSHLVFESTAPLLLGIIPFMMMFVVTSVAVLRERTSGTLERLLVSPASKSDILFGYAIAFALLALVQATIVTLVTLGFLDLHISGHPAALLVIAVLAGVLGMATGLLFSAYAKSEFQAVQFMPAFVLPQLLTCGMFVPREQMATFLQYFSSAMPITYIVEVLQDIRSLASWTSDMTFNVLVIVGFIIVALVLGAVSLRNN